MDKQIDSDELQGRGRWKQRFSYMIGASGNDASYNMMTYYFTIFMTTAMFANSSHAEADKMIAFISTLIVVIRLAEIVFDPLVGGIIDATRTKFGKFKPWLFGSAILHAGILIIVYWRFFGLYKFNTVVFLGIFAIVYLILDLTYTFRDTSFWGMIPALSSNSQERATLSSYGRVGSAIGGDSLPMFMVPIVGFFTYMMTGHHGQGASGWLWFGVIYAGWGIISMLVTVWGTRENPSVIRQKHERFSLKQIYKVIVQNDQLMWMALTYLIFALANVTSKPSIFYVFQFVLNKPAWFGTVGVVSMISGIATVPLYPILAKKITRKWVFFFSIMVMLLSEILFIVSGKNLVLVIIATTLFYLPQQFIALIVLMVVTDSIEYEQWKHGLRNEAVTISVRSMLDKIAGSLSTAIVSFIIVTAGMSGKVSAGSITAHNVFTFKAMAFAVPAVVMVISLIVFMKKVTLSEKEHARIVLELKKRAYKKEHEQQQDSKD